MSGFEYTPKNITIVNYTLTLSNTWYKVLSGNSSIRKWRVKARESTDNSFDIDFNNTSHTTFMTNGGQGISYDNCALPDIYCRSSTAGTIIEIEYWD